MGRRADVVMHSSPTGMLGAGVNYIVQASNGSLYMVYSDNGNDVAFSKSTDGGLTWTDGTIVFTGSVVYISVWYDRWSGIAADLIHIAYTESGGGDTLYRTIDTASSDALSTQTTIFAGTSTAAGGHLSITRARGGNVYCKTVIDAGAEGGFFRLPNANVPNGAWDAARTVDEAIATQDQMILVPGFAADNQDIMAIFWDASADEISRKIYDDSANSWAETSIAASMVDRVATTCWPNFDAAVDLTNSRIIMVAWSNTDVANADLRCWTVTESAITETSTNVVLNSTDDQAMCGITLDTRDTAHWMVVYAGKSDGSETFATALNLYYKETKDSGATWGPETRLTTITRAINWVAVNPRAVDGTFPICYRADVIVDFMFCNVDYIRPRAALALGV